MSDIINDISSRTGWKEEYINTLPPYKIVKKWEDWIYESWFDRGKKSEKKEALSYKKLMEQAGF